MLDTVFLREILSKHGDVTSEWALLEHAGGKEMSWEYAYYICCVHFGHCTLRCLSWLQTFEYFKYVKYFWSQLPGCKTNRPIFASLRFVGWLKNGTSSNFLASVKGVGMSGGDIEIFRPPQSGIMVIKFYGYKSKIKVIWHPARNTMSPKKASASGVEIGDALQLDMLHPEDGGREKRDNELIF